MRAVIRTCIVAIFATFSVSSITFAQAPQSASPVKGRLITAADLKAWNAIRGASLSSDGKWFAYAVSPTEGDATLYLKSTTDASKESKFSLGALAAGGAAATFTISGDSKWLGFIVAPARAT